MSDYGMWDDDDDEEDTEEVYTFNASASYQATPSDSGSHAWNVRDGSIPSIRQRRRPDYFSYALALVIVAALLYAALALLKLL